ncbi:helix-turn-helix transcriptional regulator [Actinoplanes sichuanensis]|uniref:LuxR C-terminal-related transcriptional regulator n=1 Tax=Actinoplanes sichuanensis TaxID=512349 RepID=A0ABW4A7Q4_9ACTN|nr:helix-turn-helix transcriptional regulator [Actinoplanes sichuanensis]
MGLPTTTESVYRSLLEEPGRGVAELVEHLDVTEEQVRTALDALFDLALLRESADAPQGIHVVAPEIGLRSALARQQADLARRQQEVAENQAAIARLIDDLSRTERASGPVASELLGMDAVRDQLQLLAQEAHDEVMTFMPGGAQSPVALEHARRNDAHILARNVRMRTVGLDSIRHSPDTMTHARFLTDSGAEFRTSAILPPRMVVVDRKAALIPIDPSDTRRGALLVSGAAILAPMIALFEQVWEIATPLGAATDPDRQGLTPQERALLKLLAQGLTDEAAATRLGVSHRTARRIMADLMERLNARSRFEAGLKAAQRGWL